MDARSEKRQEDEGNAPLLRGSFIRTLEKENEKEGRGRFGPGGKVDNARLYKTGSPQPFPPLCILLLIASRIFLMYPRQLLRHVARVENVGTRFV